MGGLSIWHWLIIAVVFVVFFGAKRMPDAARSLGRSLRIFKSEVTQMQNEGDSASNTVAQPPQQLPPGQQPVTASSTETAKEPKAL
ncbi:Sec-independent protein translocase subunit TatA [Nocardia paucivorans]|uniref:Sec-independent protein translocase subunit TatA n=1 Tax=Nocardia paucivorans TaxID=114259 RepID=UPI00030E68BB|nr:Sec-independent protein translocase subunit TatA [Nocardia paucivorans]